MTAKRAGLPCPSCGDIFCAEHAQLGKAPRWTCNTCGAGGELFGTFDARKSQADSPVVSPTTKKHQPWMKGAAAS